MTGQELYQLYIDANAEDSCGVEAWEDLDADQGVWNRMAKLIEESQPRQDWP